MGWGLVWLMVVLKIPVVLLLWLVWWAIRQAPDEAGAPGDDEDGGTATDRTHPPRPPHRPRARGPHGEPQPASPARVRQRPQRPLARPR